MKEPDTVSQSAIYPDVEIKGTVLFKGELLFDGKLGSGSIQGENLMLGENAIVECDIRAASLSMLGKVTGNVTATEKCELGASAELIGNLTTQRLSMEEGATLVGTVRLGPGARDHKEPNGEKTSRRN